MGTTNFFLPDLPLKMHLFKSTKTTTKDTSSPNPEIAVLRSWNSNSLYNYTDVVEFVIKLTGALSSCAAVNARFRLMW